jgi:hypothetical protein
VGVFWPETPRAPDQHHQVARPVPKREASQLHLNARTLPTTSWGGEVRDVPGPAGLRATRTQVSGSVVNFVSCLFDTLTK